MNLKGAIGRRIFAKALPAAPFAAAVGTNMIAQYPSVTGAERALAKYGMNTAASDPTPDPIWEERRKKLDTARTFLNEDRRGKYIDYYRRRRNNFTNLDPNIIALRSVSDQHKIHMHIAAEEQLDEERMTWQDSILKMFGLNNKQDRYELF